jgi:hypothetical protein
MQGLWQRFGPAGKTTPEAWAQGFVDDLLGAGALRAEGALIWDV